jgi:hypothetical protein
MLTQLPHKQGNEWSIRTTARALYLKGSHIRDDCCHRRDGSLYGGDPIAGIEFFPDDHPEAAHSFVAVGYGTCSEDLNTHILHHPYPGPVGVCRA